MLVDVEDAAADATVADIDELEDERDIVVVLVARAVLPAVSVDATTDVVVRLISVVEETEAVSVGVFVVIEMVDTVLVRSALTESLVLGFPPLEILLDGSAAFGHKATTPLPSKNNWIKVAGSATVP